MATKIVTKNSSTASAVPTASDLVQGELAVNVADKRLFTEDNAGAIVELGTNPSTLTVTGEITANGGIALGDSDKATFGASDDLQVYHSGSHSFIDDTGTGALRIRGSDIQLEKYTGENMLVANSDGAVTIYHNGSSKLVTTATGIDVTGTVVADGIESSGNFAFTAADGMQISAKETVAITIDSDDNDSSRAFQVLSGGSGSTESLIVASEDAGVNLYYDNAVKLATTATGIDVTGTATVDGLTVDGNDSYTSNIKFDYGASAPTYFANWGYKSSSDGNKVFLTITDGGAAKDVLVANYNGNVGIGLTAPDAPLSVYSPSASANIKLTRAGTSENLQLGTYYINSTNNDLQLATTTSHPMVFKTNNAERMRIDTSGAVGFKKTPPSGSHTSWSQLFIGEKGTLISESANSGGLFGTWLTDNMYIKQSTGAFANVTTDQSSAYKQEAGIHHWYSQASGSANAAITLQERMRIDSSGNLLVGQTTNAETGTGIGLVPDGTSHMYSGGTDALMLGRGGSDGDILSFNKSGTTVGSIGNDSNNLYVVFSQTNNIGLAGGGPATIFPVGNNGAVRDNAIDLGYATGRFDDIYATNGTIQTSDRNEKQDIAELSDAEQRVAVACKGLLRKFRWKDSVAEKGDEARTHFGIIAQDLQAAFAAEGLDAGDYAMFISTTWTDEETNEEKTRMGVRYSELLAFIISAI